MSLNTHQLREHVIRPTLKAIGLHSDAAEDLILGTAAQETHLSYLKQLGNGPALGIYQVEPATLADYRRWLSTHPLVRNAIKRYCFGDPSCAALYNINEIVIGNLYFATAMCRVHYRRIRAPLPAHGDVVGYAAYWKTYYNTRFGKGTEEEFIKNYNRFIL